MTQFTQNTAMPSSLWQYWRGLSGWNFYFLVKFGLLWAGYLNFHPLLNLVFAAFLLMPLPRYSLHRLRHWIALPIGFALFWHDTWLPGPESIMSQGSQVAGFSTDYLIDLVTHSQFCVDHLTFIHCFCLGFRSIGSADNVLKALGS